MAMINLEITARVVLEFKPENYPAGFTPDQALAQLWAYARDDRPWGGTDPPPWPMSTYRI